MKNYAGRPIHKMSNILDQIFADKKKELPETKSKLPLPEIKKRIGDQQPVVDVYKALEKNNSSRIIAEIKPKIRPNRDS